jgi:cytidyltransferase-like protein
MSKSLEAAVDAAARGRRSGHSVGYASGVFDLFHRGHLRFLRECKSRCDFFIVGVDSDLLVGLRKGPERPLEPVSSRIEAVLRSCLADLAFSKDRTADEFIGRIQPDRYFIPEDKVFSPLRKAILARMGTELIIIPRLKGISTSDLLSKSRQ